MDTDSFQQVLLFISGIEVYPPDLKVIFSIGLVFVLLFFSALISGSEVAFFALTPADKVKINDLNLRSSILVIRLLEFPERLLATILIANNLINIAIVIMSASITSTLFNFEAHPLVGFAFQVGVVTFLLLLFGEILPKVYANNSPKKFSIFIAPYLFVVDRLFWNLHLSRLLVRSSTFVNKSFSNERKNISMDDLSEALDLTMDDLDTDKEILEGIVNFGNIMVRDIMKSRVDVVSVEYHTPFPELMNIIVENGYSRVPVYEESFDTIKGILYIKDLLSHIDKGDDFEWQNLIREAYFIPEFKKINVLLKEFQANKKHMAIVVDEYGGSMGVITLEDVLEEIVGEIFDESDEEEALFRKLNDHSYIFEGKILLNDFYKVLNVDPGIYDEIKGEAETLAGLVLELNGEIPVVNQVIVYRNYSFTILAVDERRIKTIHLRELK